MQPAAAAANYACFDFLHAHLPADRSQVTSELKIMDVVAVSESDFVSASVVDTSRPEPVNFPSAAMLSAGPVLAKRRRDGTTANGGEFL